MKIAIFIQNITKSNGTERAVCNLANILAQKYHVTIVSICSKTGQRNCFYLSPGIGIEHWNSLFAENFLSKIFTSIHIFWKLIRFCRYKDYDVIIGSRRIITLQFPLLSSKCKKVACEHFNYGNSSLLVRAVTHLCYPILDAVVLLTHHDAAHYTFVPENKRFVIPNSLSFTCDSPANCENKRIIALGRFAPQKGFDYLLQAAVKIKQAIPDWHIDVFGSGDDEAMLKDLAKKLQVDDFVSFLPPTKEVEKELLNSGIYIMSSRYEGLPMVLIEAQECGLPIVSFDCPEGPSEIIHDGEDGFLVPLADTDALAQKIILLANDQDMRKKFGKAAKISCQQFSTERVGEMWMQLIDKIADNKEK